MPFKAEPTATVATGNQSSSGDKKIPPLTEYDNISLNYTCFLLKKVFIKWKIGKKYFKSRGGPTFNFSIKTVIWILTYIYSQEIPKLSASVKYSLNKPLHCLLIFPTSDCPSLPWTCNWILCVLTINLPQWHLVIF